MIIFCIRCSRILWIHIRKKHGEKINDNNNNPSIKIYVNKIENRITFKIKAGYYLELLTPETIKLLGSTKRKIIKDEIGENVPHLEITEVVLIYCNIGNSDYQQDSRVLYTFVPNKSFGQLLDIHQKMLYLWFRIFMYWSIVYWFTDQNSKRLEREDKINIILVIN